MYAHDVGTPMKRNYAQSEALAYMSPYVVGLYYELSRMNVHM